MPLPVSDDWEPYRPPSVVVAGALPDTNASPAVEPDPVRTTQSEPELWAVWRSGGDPGARLALVERYQRFAKTIAATVYRRSTRNEVPFEDFSQFALVGLLEAVDRYDPARGAKFETYAGPRIRGAILSGLAHMTEHHEQAATRQRLESERIASLLPETGLSQGEELLGQLGEIGVSVALGFILDAIGLSTDSREECLTDPYALVELRQVQQQVRDMVERLPASERSTIDLHYGKAKRFEQIAEELGVSPARVSQLHRQAIVRLRALISKATGCDLVY